jgi:aerotaxis receptor
VTNDSWLATPWTTGIPAQRPSAAPEPLAFVVTDENGVISDLNGVFQAWTRFAPDRLIGSAHSVVRHPGMPAGLFKLVWDRLRTGQPATAYIQNLPADGNTYTALVTMAPTTSGYLAVQQKPCRPEAADAIAKLYHSVRQAEFEAADDGIPAEAVPQRGADLLVDLLRQLGFSSYDDFMWTALPQEVDEYYRRTPSYLGPVLDDGTPAAAIMTASQELARQLVPWSQQQAELLRTWGTLSKTLVTLDPMMAEARHAADEISEDIAQETGFQALSLSINLWASMVSELEKVIKDIPKDLLALRQACAQTRFWIGLAQIHTQMVRQFALDFADPGAMARSREAASKLCVTLERDFDDLSWRMEKNAQFAKTVAERIQQLHDLWAMPAHLIVDWKTKTQGMTDEFVTRHLPEVDRQLTLAGETLTLLQTLADQCKSIARVPEMDVAHRCVQRIQQVLAVAPESQVIRVEANQPPRISEAYAQLFRTEPDARAGHPGSGGTVFPPSPGQYPGSAGTVYPPTPQYQPSGGTVYPPTPGQYPGSGGTVYPPTPQYPGSGGTVYPPSPHAAAQSYPAASAYPVTGATPYPAGANPATGATPYPQPPQPPDVYATLTQLQRPSAYAALDEDNPPLPPAR